MPDADPKLPVDAPLWQPDALEAPPAEEVPVAAIPPTPRRIIEAFLFVGGAPLTAERAMQAVRDAGRPRSQRNAVP
jgi:hypothetical protein